MWEELRAPLLPFISYGGYDMFPVGDWLNTPGKVVVRYLPVIQPDEAATRDEVRSSLCLLNDVGMFSVVLCHLLCRMCIDACVAQAKNADRSG